MSDLTVPGTQLAPLERGNSDGITRLAHRTQRGQGRRRILVGGLIALSVLLGVASAVFAATMVRSDETVGVQDVFGEAAAFVSIPQDGGFGGREAPNPEDLASEQQAWLDEHGFDGAVPTAAGDPRGLNREERQVLGMEPVIVTPQEVLAELEVTDDEVLTYRTAELYLDGTAQERRLTTLDVTHPLAGTTYDAGERTEPLTGEQGLLSPSLLGSLGAEVGDTVEVPGIGTVDVVGTVTRAYARSQEVAVLAPGRELAADGLNDFRETWVRFADGATARQYEQAAQRLGQQQVDALPEPTAEQLEQFGQMMAQGPMAEEPTGARAYVNGGDVLTRDEYTAGTVITASLPTLVGGTVTALATVVAAIVGACAFAVGVRRRIREIGMLGAIGTTPKQLRRLLRREGLVIGLGGALVGAVLGLAVAYAGQPLAERVVDRDLQVVLPVVGIALPVVLGGLGAFLAALWPARTAARVPITTALAGRVPLGHVPRWLPVAGAVAAGVGVALLAELVVGTGPRGGLDALQLLAAVLLATLGTAALGVPVIAGGGRVADRLPLLGRLALRDAARQRTRSAAAVAALVPVMALPVAAGTMIHSENQNVDQGGVFAEDGTRLEALEYRDGGASRFALVNGPSIDGRQVPPSDQFLTDVTTTLPGAVGRAPVVYLGVPGLPEVATVALPYDTDGRIDPTAADSSTINQYGGAWSDRLALATPELLDALGLSAGAVPDDGALMLAGTSGAVLPSAAATLPVVQLDPDAQTTTANGEGHRLLGSVELARETTVSGGVDPGTLLGPAAADRLGLDEVGRATVLRLERPPSWAEASTVWDLGMPEQGSGVWMAPAPPFWGTPLGVAVAIGLAVLAVVLVVSLVAGMTSALAATESDGDVRKAVALGAAPSLRRSLHGLQAWWHAVIAAVLGSALGLAIAWAFIRSTGGYAEYGPDGEVIAQVQAAMTVPWLPLLAWVVVLPVLVGLVIAGVMRSAPVGAPRRRTA